jgi:hypothetical protein
MVKFLSQFYFKLSHRDRQPPAVRDDAARQAVIEIAVLTAERLNRPGRKNQ